MNLKKFGDGNSLIRTINFKFDATNYYDPQQLEIILDKESYDNNHNMIGFNDTYKFIFIETSNYFFNIKTIEKELNKEQLAKLNHHNGDCMQIESIDKLIATNKQSCWQIKLIDKIGYINIYANELIIELVNK